MLIAGLLAEQLASGRLPANAPGYSGAEYLFAAGATAFAFLGCVLAHELSHAVVARREGIGVDGITLWFLGGVTRMTSEATTPKAELAGRRQPAPLTSLVLGVVMVVVGVAARAGAVSPLLVEALTWLGVINLVVAVFNALPGAPLDGGRLRAHVACGAAAATERRATRAASRAGEILGLFLIASGLLVFVFDRAGGGGLWIAFVGWFLRAGARAEERGGRTPRQCRRRGSPTRNSAVADMNEHHYERGIKLAAKALSRTHIARTSVHPRTLRSALGRRRRRLHHHDRTPNRSTPHDPARVHPSS